jgi:thymus-specific serine protease
LARFRRFIQNKYNLTDNNKWIVFGSSYAGVLAAWFRLKYPHLVDIAVSSSAPLLLKVDFYEYFEIVGKSLDTFKPGCSSAVAEATAELIDTLNMSKYGIEFVKQSFR